MRTLDTPTSHKMVIVAPGNTQKKRSPLDIAILKPQASGLWPGIINHAGIPDDHITCLHVPCPRCGGTDRWRCFDDFIQTGGAICNQCGTFGDGFELIMWWRGINFPEALRFVAEYFGIQPVALKSNPKPVAKPKKPKAKAEDASEINTVLRRVSEILPLRDDHRDDLVKRGFTDESIDRLGCWSIGTDNEVVKLSTIQYEHKGFVNRVPGFRVLNAAAREGMAISIRDRSGRMVGCQVRHFADTAANKYTWLSGVVSPGCPVHHTPGCNGDSIDVLRITEGPLKAELSYQMTGIPSASVQGVSNRKVLFAAIKEIKPAKVLVAFDADAAGNPDVATTVRESVALCRELKIGVAIETWDATNKGIDDALAAGAKINQISDPNAIDEHLDSLAGEAKETPKEKPKTEIYILPDDPEELATKNLRAYRLQGRDICHWKGSWFTWKGKCWQPQSESYVRARLRAFVEADFRSRCEEDTDCWQTRVDAGKFDSDEEATKARPKKIRTTATTVRNALDAMQSMVVVPDHVEMGRLLSDRKPRNYWPVQNGLIDLNGLDGSITEPSELIHPHSADWFSDHVHVYSLDIDANCPTWIEFLDTVLTDPDTGIVDTESIDTLQRWFGYAMMPSVSLQKMLFLIGESRSGKGVISRVLKRIIGERFTSSPMLKSFGGDFGLQPLLGKRLAIVGDLKLDRYKHDAEAALETLLNVVGEDSIDVNTKGTQAATSVALPVKFMLLGNSLPAFRDPSMALINRVILIHFRNSFVGREDSELTKKLLAEIDGIFLWSLAGLRKMLGDYRLPQPDSGRAQIENFRKLVSPIRGFVSDCCLLPGENDSAIQLYVDRDEIFTMWRIYCERIGREHPGTRSSFVRQLTESYPAIQESKLGSGRNGDQRWWAILNIRLSSESEKQVAESVEEHDKNGTQKRDADSKERY